jgi:hypothetical protein
MNYTYEIEDFRPEEGYLFVKYSSEGKSDTYLNLNPEDWTEEGLRKLITGQIHRVKHKWRTINLDAPEPIVGAQQVVETEPEAVILPEVIVDPMERITADRRAIESGGIQWGDYYFDTSPESQAKISAAVTGGRFRTGPITWKCERVTEEGEMELAYVQLRATEIEEIAALVQDHVQKCFDTEALCYEALIAGKPIDFRDTFNG